MPECIEGYYIESAEGLLFAVKGAVHPPEVVTAYMRYVPDPKGERRRGRRRYRRLYGFEEQEQLLRENCPACLFFDPVSGERLQGLPRDHIVRYYDPCLKLACLRENKSRGGLGALEEKAIDFAVLLAERSGVLIRSIGISGSILVDLHTPDSDIDLVVYGSENCLAVRKALWDLLTEPDETVRGLNDEEMARLHIARSEDTPMDFEKFARLERRKVIQGVYRGSEYFIRFVKSPGEVDEHYGDRSYVSLGRAEIEAIIVDAWETLFTPCAYRIGEVRFTGGGVPPCAGSLKGIASFRGRFCEQAQVGESVRARGKL